MSLASQAEEVRRLAGRYISRGLSPIPIPLGRKNPEIRSWQNLRITAENVGEYFNGRPQNIGILLGGPSRGATDVDQDVKEAVALAPRFLPKTLESGRENAPHTHRWYRAPGAKNERYKDLDGQTILELRSTGCQTLVAPSEGPEGDSYLWHDPEPGMDASMTEVEPEVLRRACNLLATATLIARHLPPVGGRHDFALALAGYLLREDRLDDDTTLHLMHSAWFVGGGASREAERDLAGIVSDTARNLSAGREVMGGGRLDEIVPGLPRIIGRWWGWGSERYEGAREEAPEEERPPDAEPPEEEVAPRGPLASAWPVLDEAAYHGLAGEIVRAIEPHTEADPVAVLVNLLSAFGNAIGQGAFFSVGATKHHLKINAVLVGETAKGRKGMSWDYVDLLMHGADSFWSESRVQNGLSSGEGLIHAVRDRVTGEDKDGDPITIDSGAEDKRLMVMEGEFAGVLKVCTREGNTLSAIIRAAWDRGRLNTLTRNSPLKATDSHVTILGHITRGELRRLLATADAENGFANRFVWIMVRRSKELAYGGEWSTVNTAPLLRDLSAAIGYGKHAGEVTWGESAKPAWSAVYGPLSEGSVGLFGAVTSRAEAHAVRLACVYAVMDHSATIEAPHLHAALALWKYAEDSARFTFGRATGDTVADRIEDALAEKPEGVTRTEIRDLFKRNKSAAEIGEALAVLERLGRAECFSVSTGGRSSEKWVLKRRGYDGNDKYDQNDNYDETSEGNWSLQSLKSFWSYPKASTEYTSFSDTPNDINDQYDESLSSEEDEGEEI